MGVKREIMNNFLEHFSEDQWERSCFDGVNFLCFSPQKNVSLTAPFQLEEVEEIINSCDGNKSPGPNDFNFCFVKTFWVLLKSV